MTSNSGNLAVQYERFSFEGFRELSVALIFISSFFVKIEPALTDFFVLLAVMLYFRSGLHFSRYLGLPLFFLFVFVLSGLVSSIAISAPSRFEANYSPLTYPFVLGYTSISSVFLAAYIAADPMRRYLRIERAYWIGATIGAVLGLALYAKVEPLLSIFRALGTTSYGDYAWRVTGGYKDPNVFATWLVFPVISMLHALMVGRLRITFISAGSFLAMTAALLLAFSRGAWLDAFASAMLIMLLGVVLSPSNRQRQRMVLTSFVAFVIVVGLLTILLSIPSLQAAFLDRFALVKSYDAGETGRFGNQLNSIPMLLGLPLGFGPYQFQETFAEAPHNTFLNAFASGGWPGGIFYFLLFLTNAYIAFQLVFTRSNLQSLAIPVAVSFLVMTLQGIQIDNEHWRHLYWLMGLSWGLFAAMREDQSRKQTDEALPDGWALSTRVS